MTACPRWLPKSSTPRLDQSALRTRPPRPVYTTPGLRDANDRRIVIGGEFVDAIRTVGAMARAMLIQAAATQWKVPMPPSARPKRHGAGDRKAQKAAYGALADAAMALPMPAKVALKDAKDYKLIGKPTRRIDAPPRSTAPPGSASTSLRRWCPTCTRRGVACPAVRRGRARSMRPRCGHARRHPRHPTSFGVAVVAKNFWQA